MNSCLAVDISLLAVLIALHATKKNKNIELVVMALLFSHVIMTTELFSKLPFVDSDTDNAVDTDSELVDASTLGVAATSLGTEEADRQEEQTTPKHKKEELKDRRKSVSDGEFDRMTSVTPTRRVSPNDSSEANVDLAKARTSFFAELFPNGDQ